MWQDCEIVEHSDSIPGPNLIMQQAEGQWRRGLPLLCCLLHSTPQLISCSLLRTIKHVLSLCCPHLPAYHNGAGSHACERCQAPPPGVTLKHEGDIVHKCTFMLHLQVDPQERFSSEHKLLTLDLDLPPELLQRSGPPADLGDRDLSLDDVAGHLDLVRHQYIQVGPRHRIHK